MLPVKVVTGHAGKWTHALSGNPPLYTEIAMYLLNKFLSACLHYRPTSIQTKYTLDTRQMQALTRRCVCDVEQRKHATGGWLDDYLFGFEHVIYTETMSDAFVGMTFTEAAE